MRIKENKTLWTKNFVFIIVINVLLFLGMQMQLSALPVYLKELSGLDATVGICIALGTVAALLARPLAGYAVDRFGRRSLILIGLLMMIVSLFSYSWFPVVWVIIVIRTFNGFSWGLSTTTSNTIATDVIPHDRLGEGMGFFSLSQSVSMSVAPAIGLFLVDNFGYKYMTFVAAGLFCAAYVPALLLEYKKVEINPKKTKLILFEKTAIRPAIIMIFIGIPLGSVLSFSALYGNSCNYPNGAIFLSCFAVSMLISRPIAGRLVDRLGFKKVILPGFILYIVSMVFLAAVQTYTMFLCAALWQGVAYGFVQNSIQTMSIINAPPERRGAANATFFTGFDFGIGIGNLLAGIISGAIGYSHMYLTMTVPLAIGLGLYFLLASKIECNN